MTDLSPVWDFLNQEFTKSFVGSMAGAAGGAWAAQFIAERSKGREELLKEIRNTNAAITLAFGMTNTFLNIKMQHVEMLRNKFNEDRQRLLKVQMETGPQPKIFEFQADVQFLHMPKVPMRQLLKLAFENISTPTRAISLVEALDRAVHALEQMLAMRNALIEEFRQGFPPPAYFGLKVGDRIDNRYASSIDGIYGYTDDCIFFSKLLSEDLTRYGNKLKDRLPRRWFSTAPHIASADFSPAQKFIPPDSNYPSCKTSFITPAEPPRFWHLFGKK